MSKYNLPKTYSLCDLSQSDLLNCSFQPPQSILLPDVMETESGFFSFHLGIHFLRCFDLILTDRTKVERSFCNSFSTIPADCNIPLFFLTSSLVAHQMASVMFQVTPNAPFPPILACSAASVSPAEHKLHSCNTKAPNFSFFLSFFLSFFYNFQHQTKANLVMKQAAYGEKHLQYFGRME